jgi:pyrroline-5-carboxylate reductase
MKVTFIGGGNMAEAIISSLLNNKLALPQDIRVSDKLPERRSYLAETYRVLALPDSRQALVGSDVILLAIKPQNLAEVMAELRGLISPQQLVVSIIAGKRIETIRQGLNHLSLVRAMPNTPAQIGEGATVWTSTPEVTDQQKQWAAEILGAMGLQIYSEEERFLDMATAVSGSGPAYVFLFVEAMMAAAEKLGFSSSVAKELVLQTLIGSTHLLLKSGKLPAELRRLVTSPGGTTAEAVARFEEGGFSELVNSAVQAAYEKSLKLGG